MKKIIKTILLFSQLIIVSSCDAQSMVRTIDDTKKLELNKDQFIGKPLNILLKEIVPRIQTVIGSQGSSETPSFINFYYTQKSDYNKYRSQGKFPLTIKVYLQGNFHWNERASSNKEWYKWTKEDEKEFGSLIVTDIKVYNEN